MSFFVVLYVVIIGVWTGVLLDCRFIYLFLEAVSVLTSMSQRLRAGLYEVRQCDLLSRIILSIIRGVGGCLPHGLFWSDG